MVEQPASYLYMCKENDSVSSKSLDNACHIIKSFSTYKLED